MVLKQSTKKKFLFAKGDIVLFSCLALVLLGMTWGFAHYSVLLQTQGVTTVTAPGKVHFTELTLVSSSNVDTSYQPSHTDDTLDFNLHFSENDTSQPYTATYRITVQNDTFHNQTFQGVDFSPTITDSDGVNACTMAHFRLAME